MDHALSAKTAKYMSLKNSYEYSILLSITHTLRKIKQNINSLLKYTVVTYIHKDRRA